LNGHHHEVDGVVPLALGGDGGYVRKRHDSDGSDLDGYANVCWQTGRFPCFLSMLKLFIVRILKKCKFFAGKSRTCVNVCILVLVYTCVNVCILLLNVCILAYFQTTQFRPP
jgi:hypothetical protein